MRYDGILRTLFIILDPKQIISITFLQLMKIFPNIVLCTHISCEYVHKSEPQNFESPRILGRLGLVGYRDKFAHC
jgi:hypothetical protein